jgi:hypothetical protein
MVRWTQMGSLATTYMNSVRGFRVRRRKAARGALRARQMFWSSDRTGRIPPEKQGIVGMWLWTA